MIEIGETVNVDVFMVLDAADQVAGISAATLHLELGAPFVDVIASSDRSVFPVAATNIVTDRGVPSPLASIVPFVVFSQFGVTVTSPRALLGSLSITGSAPGSYDLRAIRIANFPLFTAPRDPVNRYDFASDETLRITVPCGGDPCEVASPNPVEPEPPATPPVIPTIITTVTTDWRTLTSTETGTFASTLFGTLTSTTQVVPEPSTFALLGLALTGLMFLRNPRRERSKRSPGS